MNQTAGTAGIQTDHIHITYRTTPKYSNATIVQRSIEYTEDKPQGIHARVLLELAKIAKNSKWEGPIDLASNHDKYFMESYK
jgi:REP element-mobilizing transposase RayT